MKAIGKNIVIQPIKEGVTQTKGGLILSESHKKDIRYRGIQTEHPPPLTTTL